MGNQQPSKVEEKTCRVCKKSRFISNFKSYVSSGNTLRKNICIPCEKEWHKQHNANHPDRENRLAKQRLSSQKHRNSNPEKCKEISRRSKKKCSERDRIAIYLHYGNECTCCGETNHKFLTVDHIENDGHIERKKGFYTSGSQFYRYIIQRDFPSDYQLLCYNCNLGKARNGGVCPHQEGPTIIPEGSTAKRLEADRVPSGR